MLSEEQNDNTLKPAAVSSVGLLIRSPKRRLAKLGRKSSNGSVQSKLSSITTRSAESALVRQPARRKAQRHNHRLAAIFSRSTAQDGSTVALADERSKMPAPDSGPGILKIYGSGVSQGAHYKSVLATVHSTANEIVREALERYGLDDDADIYVLCDVVGWTGEDHQWKSECFRVVGKQERPLLLQALWKPTEGLSRRFEIQRRAAVEKSHTADKTAATTDTKRTAQRGSRVTSMLVELHSVDGVQDADGRGLWRSLSELELTPAGAQDAPNGHAVPVQSGEWEETESNRDYSPLSTARAPLNIPYFLLLQGYNHKQDLILYLLGRTTTAFGRCKEDEGGGEGGMSGADFPLWAPDILPLHCQVLRQEALHGEEEEEEEEAVMLLEPFCGAPITLNGTPVTQRVELHTGDLLRLGEHYLLMYKDHTAATNHKMPPWFAWTSQHHKEPVCAICSSSLHPSRRTASLRLKDLEGQDLCLAYELEHEDHVLEEIFSVVEDCGYNEPKLMPAFLLCLCVQHSAVTFGVSDFHRLLLKVTSQVQATMWDKTKELATTQDEKASSGGRNDVRDVQPLGVVELVPDLQPLVLWMANALELLHFIQQEVPRLLPWAQEEEEEDEEEDEEDLGNPRSPRKEAISVLEEVVMFTFQQSVYYLTKTLYASLPGLLDSNPFSEDGQLHTPKAITGILGVFEETVQLLTDFQVHRDISSQLLLYLFFFTNTSVFNTLMGRGSTPGFYQWSKGVQIRANLDLLMDWTQGAGLAGLATDFFQKLSSAVNLLATPRETLLQSSWGSLRSDFEHLNPAQLHHMLCQYHSGRAYPTGWSPTPEDAAAAQRTADVLENFDSHPPLVLPSSAFCLELGKPIGDASLLVQLHKLQGFIHSLSANQSSVHLQQVENTHSEDPALGALEENSVSQEMDADMVHKIMSEPHLSKVTVTPSQQAGGEFSSGGSSLTSCETMLTNKLKILQIRGVLAKQPDISYRRSLALDPSCLLTPPNTPQGSELTDLEASMQAGALDHQITGQHTQGANRSLDFAGLPSQKDEAEDDEAEEDDEEDEEVFAVDLQRGPHGLGLALVDGTKTPLRMSGVFVRSLVPDSPAAQCAKLSPGDRILAVNGQSLVGLEYERGRDMIRTAGDKLSLLVAKSMWKTAVKTG